MKKLKLSQVELDKIVSVARVDVDATIYGLGRLDSVFEAHMGKKQIWQYTLWTKMFERCYSKRSKRLNPTYVGAEVCAEWFSFGNFFEWVNKEVGYRGKPVGFDLDKDIIIKGNKRYSPDACSLVPREVNKILLDSAASRGDWPVGVYFYRGKGRFSASLRCDGRQKHLGYYATAEDAFFAYKVAKERNIKAVALRHRDVLKPAVFESLMNWKIEL